MKQYISFLPVQQQDRILSLLLVNCVIELSYLLFKNCIHSLTSGVVFHSFKRAAITPVSNSGDGTIIGNYRPILLTLYSVKYFRGLLENRYPCLLTKKGCSNNTKHGFRSGRSCLSGLLNVFDDVIKMLDGGCFTVDMVYLDFSKGLTKWIMAFSLIN